MRCPRCEWPATEMTTLSTHRTSEGWVTYRRCMCGALFVDAAGAGAGVKRTEPGTPLLAVHPARA